MGTPTRTPEAFQAERMKAFEHKMRQAGLAREVIHLFTSYLGELLFSEKTGFIPEGAIEPVLEQDVPKQETLGEEDREIGLSCLDQAVVIKLNGGLGTSMGMPYAKSLLEVKAGFTFLDVTLLQAGQGQEAQRPLTLILMNSFNTHRDTQNYLAQKGCLEDRNLKTFTQHFYPKVLQDSLFPAESSKSRELEWNPPGHGDFYAALLTSGILEELLEQGKRYAFVSNVDNLGAVLDPGILGYFVRRGFPFLMEVACRRWADRKGGHIAKDQEGRLLLREVAQCPEEDLEHFQNIEKHGYFNTNNIWLDLKALKEFIETSGLPKLPLIVNPKTLDPRDEGTPGVYQLETAIGAAIGVFARSGVIRVGRERFLPVKKTNDLLVIRSDCYTFDPDYRLRLNPKRTRGSLVVDLDERYYKLVDQFEARFPKGVPSLVACDSLTVRGDFCFGAGVVCKGGVLLENRRKEQIPIEDNRELKGRLVFE